MFSLYIVIGLTHLSFTLTDIGPGCFLTNVYMSIAVLSLCLASVCFDDYSHDGNPCSPCCDLYQLLCLLNIIKFVLLSVRDNCKLGSTISYCQT